MYVALWQMSSIRAPAGWRWLRSYRHAHFLPIRPKIENPCQRAPATTATPTMTSTMATTMATTMSVLSPDGAFMADLRFTERQPYVLSPTFVVAQGIASRRSNGIGSPVISLRP